MKPETCIKCKSPAYIGFFRVYCSSPRCEDWDERAEDDLGTLFRVLPVPLQDEDKTPTNIWPAFPWIKP